MGARGRARREQFGKLDILVNNAAIIGLEGIMETSIEPWNRVIAVNQTGTFLGMRAAIPAMRRAGGGSIVNISSVLATMGSGNSASLHGQQGRGHGTHAHRLRRARDRGHPRQRGASGRRRDAHGGGVPGR